MNGFSLHLKRVWRGRAALCLLMLVALSTATFMALGATESAPRPVLAERQASSQRPLAVKRSVNRKAATGQTRRATASVAVASPVPVLRRRAVEGYTPLTGISLVFNNNSLYQPGQVAIATITLSGSGADARPVTLRSDPADRVSIRPEDATFQLAPGTPREVRVTMPATPGVYAFVASSSGQQDRKEVEVAVRTWDVGTPIRPGTIVVTSGAATGGGTPRPTATPTPTPAPATGTTTGGTTPTATPTPTPAPTTGGTTTPTPRPTATPTPAPNIVAVAPGEVVTLTVEGARDEDHYRQSQTQGNENDTLTYAWSGSNIAAGAASPTPSTTVTAPQSGRASFTCTINDTPLARGSALGTRDDTTPVTARVTLVVNTGTGTGTGGTGGGIRPTPFVMGGDSNVTLRLVRPGQEETMGQGLSDTVGGSVVVQMIIEVGAKGRVRGDVESVMVRLKEDAEDVDHPFEQNHADVSFGFTQSDWVVWKSSDTSPTPTREPNAGNAKTENTSADTTYFYVKSFTWNTARERSGTSANPAGTGARVASTLLGHNAPHEISLVEVNSELTSEFPFEKQAPTGTAWEAAPFSVTETTCDVKNLVIAEAKAGDDNEDYFKFDPESTDSSLSHPRLTFKIEDEGDRHRYQWYLWVKPTRGENNSRTISGIMASHGTQTITINQAGTGYTQDEPLTEWGTYTFDLRVIEIQNSSTADIGEPSVELRSEKLFVPEIYTIDGVTKAGHKLKMEMDEEDGDVKASISYYLQDSEGQPITNARNASSGQVLFLGPTFNELATVPLEVEVRTAHDNIELYTITDEEESSPTQLNDIFRAMIVGEDSHGEIYRDHANKRMDPANQTGVRGKFTYDDYYMHNSEKGHLLPYTRSNNASDSEFKKAFWKAGWKAVAYSSSATPTNPAFLEYLEPESNFPHFSWLNIRGYKTRTLLPTKHYVHVIGAWGNKNTRTNVTELLMGQSSNIGRWSYVFRGEILRGAERYPDLTPAERNAAPLRPGLTPTERNAAVEQAGKQITIHEVGHQFIGEHHSLGREQEIADKQAAFNRAGRGERISAEEALEYVKLRAPDGKICVLASGATGGTVSMDFCENHSSAIRGFKSFQ